VWFLVHQTAVPAFFLADGSLYGKRWRQPMSGAAQVAFLSASARRLLLPWLIFSVLYLALRLVSQAAGVAGGEPVVVNSPGALAMALWRGAAAEGLYFLPALMIVRLITPHLHRLVLGSPMRALGLAMVLLVGWRLVVEPHLPFPTLGVDPLLAAMTGLCFAAVGWALAETPPQLALRAPLVAAVVLAVAGAALEGRAAAMSFQTSSVLALWVLAVTMPARIGSPSEWLGRRTMQIYLLHAPYIIKPCSVAVATLPPILGLPIAVAMAIVGALGLAFGLERLGLGWLWEAPSGGAPTAARTKDCSQRAVS
jgi:fucose 4-O-acetylase-like acetyltransferase